MQNIDRIKETEYDPPEVFIKDVLKDVNRAIYALGWYTMGAKTNRTNHRSWDRN